LRDGEFDFLSFFLFCVKNMMLLMNFCIIQVYQRKLLNHVSRDHNMTLKPAHLSYKCTVCTATFGMYKQFESHVYSAHSTVAKKAMDAKKQATTSGRGSGVGVGGGGGGSTSLLKPVKINDEITIIPQPATKSRNSGVQMELESHVIGERVHVIQLNKFQLIVDFICFFRFFPLPCRLMVKLCVDRCKKFCKISN
jgi:hypothetical protein